MADSKLILKWTNKFSGEEGYVKTVSVKEGHLSIRTISLKQSLTDVGASLIRGLPI